MGEQNLANYEELLNSYSRVGTTVIIIAIIIFLIMFFVSFRSAIIKQRGVKVALALLLLIPIVLYFTSVLPYQLDIKQQAYEEYQGEFYVEDYYYATRSGTYILIKTKDNKESIRYRAPSDLKEIKINTTYEGMFVIAKHSKTLVDISVEKKAVG